MRESRAIGLAVVLTPIAPVIATAIGSGAIVDPDRRIAAGILLWGYPIGLIVTTFLGVPVFIVARHKRVLRWWSAPLLGVPIGLLIVTPVALGVSPRVRRSWDVGQRGGPGWLVVVRVLVDLAQPDEEIHRRR